MNRIARWAGMTEGQAYTVVIGLVIGLTTALLGIPAAMRDQVTQVARAATVPARAQTQPPTQSAPPASPAMGSPTDAFGAGGLSTGSAPISGSTDTSSLGTQPTGSDATGPGALGAGGPTRQGWWTSLSFLNPSVPGFAFPVSYPPDVPGDGLYVQGGSSSPEAYAAVVYQVPQGIIVSKLTLQVAPNSFTSPAAALLACPLQPNSVGFAPAQGGDSKQGPQYDCQHAAKGTADSGGKAYSFDIRALVAGNQLGVAIVPSTPGDRAVFSRPGDGSLSAS